MLSHVTRPRCANWNGRSESVPPCGYNRAPSRTVGCVDIFWSADHGPSRPCRSPLGILLLVPSESPRVAAVAGFHSTCTPIAWPPLSSPRTPFPPPRLSRLRWRPPRASEPHRWLHENASTGYPQVNELAFLAV